MIVDWIDPFTSDVVKLNTDTKVCNIHHTAKFGENVYLGSDCHIGPFARIGDNVKIGESVVIGKYCVIQNNDPCEYPICLPMFPGRITKDVFATTITPSWITFACTAKSPDEWWEITDREIIALSDPGIGKGNVRYWRTYKNVIFEAAKAAGYWAAKKS